MQFRMQVNINNSRDIQKLSLAFGVNAEERKDGTFPVFFRHVRGKKVLFLTDESTLCFARQLFELFKAEGVAFSVYTCPSKEPALDEATIENCGAHVQDAEYLLAVGSGTLNDLAKYVGSRLRIPSGVYATAPSMDGYTSGVTPVIEKGKKITYPAQVASDVLIDYSVLTGAPRIMTGAGVGDILAKYTALSDWKISSLLKNEHFVTQAAALMRNAVDTCNAGIPAILAGEQAGVKTLMNALLISGYAMVLAGNSRPASGAEHHMSHYLEMDFLRRGRSIPLHGIKVGLGTAVSLYLYRTVKERKDFAGREIIIKQAEELPSPEDVLNVLRKFDCPTQFSEIGISRDTMRNMLFEAHLIRDRYTILALYHENNLMKEAADDILDRYY